MTAEQQADELKRLLFARLGIQRSTQLECPREKSSMTPCVARDGALAVADDVCVGCEHRVEALLAAEQERNCP